MVLFLRSINSFRYIAENESEQPVFGWNTHSPRDVGKLRGHKKKSFGQGTLLALFCVLYVDNGAFTFEDHNQLTQGLTLISHHFTRFGLEVHLGKGKKSSKTECIFFSPSGFSGRKFNLPAKNSR